MAVPTEAVVVFWSGCLLKVCAARRTAVTYHMHLIVTLVCDVTLVLWWGLLLILTLEFYQMLHVCMSALSIGLPCRAMRCDHSPPTRVHTVRVRVSSACVCARRLSVVWFMLFSRIFRHLFRLYFTRHVTSVIQTFSLLEVPVLSAERPIPRWALRSLHASSQHVSIE